MTLLHAFTSLDEVLSLDQDGLIVEDDQQESEELKTTAEQSSLPALDCVESVFI